MDISSQFRRSSRTSFPRRRFSFLPEMKQKNRQDRCSYRLSLSKGRGIEFPSKPKVPGKTSSYTRAAGKENVRTKIRKLCLYIYRERKAPRPRMHRICAGTRALGVKLLRNASKGREPICSLLSANNEHFPPQNKRTKAERRQGKNLVGSLLRKHGALVSFEMTRSSRIFPI